jgi:hypothetical protein
MINIPRLIERLDRVMNDVRSSSISMPSDIRRGLIGYIGILEAEPLIKEWIQTQKNEWTLHKEDLNLPNIWPSSYNYLYSIYDFYVNQKATLSEKISVPDIYHCLVDLHRDVVAFLAKQEVLLERLADGGASLVLDQSPYFSQETGLLYLNNLDKIKFKKLTYQHVLLKYLFEQNLGDEVMYGSILEFALNDHDGDRKWTRCHTACRNINDKIRKYSKAKIDDFLIFNTGKNGFVSINKKYLSTF